MRQSWQEAECDPHQGYKLHALLGIQPKFGTQPQEGGRISQLLPDSFACVAQRPSRWHQTVVAIETYGGKEGRDQTCQFTGLAEDHYQYFV